MRDSNENVIIEEKWKNISDKNVSLVKWKPTTLLKKLFCLKYFSNFP